jgi:hypothetical protein
MRRRIAFHLGDFVLCSCGYPEAAFLPLIPKTQVNHVVHNSPRIKDTDLEVFSRSFLYFQTSTPTTYLPTTHTTRTR